MSLNPSSGRTGTHLSGSGLMTCVPCLPHCPSGEYKTPAFSFSSPCHTGPTPATGGALPGACCCQDTSWPSVPCLLSHTLAPDPTCSCSWVIYKQRKRLSSLAREAQGLLREETEVGRILSQHFPIFSYPSPDPHVTEDPGDCEAPPSPTRHYRQAARPACSQHHTSAGP